MTARHLRSRLLVERPLDEVFAFFERPGNLSRITPPWMGMRIVSGDLAMREGLQLEYTITPFPFTRARWRSLIASYDPPRSFVDVQLRGPYARWEHRHTFRADGDRTVVEDEVTYELPFGWLGDLVEPLLVRPRLRAIFEHRAQAVARLLPGQDRQEDPMTVAVAGGTGFVGGGIVAELVRRGQRVVVLTHRPDRARHALADQVEVREADVNGDPAALAAALDGVDALVIALAFPNAPMEDPARGWTYEHVDADGTTALVEAARRAGVRRLVYLSGAGAAPNASRHWFRAKWRAEQAVRGTGIPFTIIRPTWIYGPRDVALNRFLGFARWLPFVPLTGSGRQLLAPVFIGDIGRLAADALEDRAAANQVFEIGGPETLTMREIVATALRVSRKRRLIMPAPAALLRLAAHVLQHLPGRLLTPDGVDFVNQPATVDVEPLLAVMPRRLTPLAEGLATYLGPGAGADAHGAGADIRVGR
jgi:uncharacterized protein YbjT (DUF2867 family)/ligand-binding SRPBCC domain-containing protein